MGRRTRLLGAAALLMMVALTAGGGDVAVAADGPTGSFTLDNGATVTDDGFVSIQYQASGPNPIAVVYTSDSSQRDANGNLLCFSQWPYGQAINTFSLFNAGCQDNNSESGPKTVYIQFVDDQGLFSPVYQQTIVLAGPPTWTLNPQWQFTTPQTVTKTNVSLHASWLASGATALTYSPKLSINSGPFTTPAGVATTATGFNTKTTFHTFLQAQASPLDAFGNASIPNSKIAGAEPIWIDQSDSHAIYKGTWKTQAGTGFLGGGDRFSAQKNASVTFTCGCFTLSWVTSVGPKRGIVNVMIDGTPAGSVDLHAVTAGNRRVVWSHAFAAGGTHTLTLTVAGTTGRPRIDVDAFLQS